MKKSNLNPLCAHAHFLGGSTLALGQGLKKNLCGSFLMQADTLLETSDPVINCSLSVIATITVIQGLLVKAAGLAVNE